LGVKRVRTHLARQSPWLLFPLKAWFYENVRANNTGVL